MNKNCAVIIDEHKSLPYCAIKSEKALSDDALEEYAKQWINEHNDNCSWSNYRYVIMNINDAPKIKRINIIK